MNLVDFEVRAVLQEFLVYQIRPFFHPAPFTVSPIL